MVVHALVKEIKKRRAEPEKDTTVKETDVQKRAADQKIKEDIEALNKSIEGAAKGNCDSP